MPCPHHDIKIIQRSNHQSAVASAAYQSGERLFSEYDQKQKYYSHKSEIVHTEIMLPPHAPPAYADRNTLWNAAEAIEKQWNSQLARRIVLAIPREIPPEQHADLMKEINTLLSHIANFEAHKPVHVEYAAIRFKKPREQFAAAHRDELDAYNAAIRYFKVHLKEKKYSIKKLNEEQTQLAGEVAGYKERLSALQEDVKILRDVRHWLNQVLPSEQYRQTAEPGKKPSIQQAVKGRTQRIREEQAEKRKQPRTEKKQDMEL